MKGNIWLPEEVSSTVKGDLIKWSTLSATNNLIHSSSHDRPEEPGSVGVRERPAVPALLSLVLAAATIFISFVERERERG